MLASRSLTRLVLIAFVTVLTSVAAAAQDCPGDRDALGTARTLAVDAASTPRVGHKQFPDTLPLAPKELVLTFDDGPWPGTTPAVLAALKAECVKATFFLLGRNAQAHPGLVRREAAEGHTIGHHSFSHPLLRHMDPDKAMAEVDKGVRADNAALAGRPSAPFFRFPGFASAPVLLDRLQARGVVVFGADVWASDWNEQTPDAERELLLKRIDTAGRGIVLLHDTRGQTARMLPSLLRALKARGYRIVHVVPAGGSHPAD